MMRTLSIPRLLANVRQTPTLAVLAAIACFAAPASNAAPHKTLYVGTSIGSNAGCTSTGYTSVQAAVDAAPSGATVFLCSFGSPYLGPVVITKSISLTGDPGVAIKAPVIWPGVNPTSLPPQFTTDNLIPPMAIVLVWGSGANAAISNLTIEGPFNVSGCGAEIYGVLVLSGGSVVMTGDTVTNVRHSDNNLLGCQEGVGIQVGREYWPDPSFNFHVENFVGNAVIMNSTVTGYQKNGITVDGPGSTGSISSNTITGDGRVPYNAQNGIQISRGAGGDVRDNAISNNAYTGGGFASAGGVIIFGGCGDPLVTGVQIMKNTLTNNDVGIFLNNYNNTCDAPAATQTNDKAVNNTIMNNAVTNVCTAGAGCFGFITYQVGVSEVGNNDKVINNDISGTGYINPLNNPSGGIYIEPVDSSFTTAAKVHANRTK